MSKKHIRAFWVTPHGTNRYSDWEIHGLPQGSKDEFFCREVMADELCPFHDLGKEDRKCDCQNPASSGER